MFLTNRSSAMRPAEQHRDLGEHLVLVERDAVTLRHCQVTPSARPRGMMVTLHRVGLGQLAATMAWPDSWYAVAVFRPR